MSEDARMHQGGSGHDAARLRRRLAIALGAWAVVATAIALSGALAALPPWGAAVAVLAPPVAMALLATRPPVRAALTGLDVRWPIAWNVIRAPIGLALLAMEARGQLPAAFAIHAGWGDLVAGVLAAFAVRAARIRTRESRRLVLAWNALACLDMLAVVVSAQWLLLVHGDVRMAALRDAPGSLLPALVVPLVLITHVIVFVNLASGRRDMGRRTTDARGAQ